MIDEGAPEKPRHWRQHLERQTRERQARRISKEYRQAQRDADLAAQPHKVCAGCRQSLPLSAFSTKGPGKHNSRCRPCHSAKQAARKRAKHAAWSDEERDAHRAADRAAWYARQGRSGETGMSLADRAKAADERRACRAAAKAARMAEAQQRRRSERAEANAARTAAKAARVAEALAKRALAQAEAVARRQMELEGPGLDAAEVEEELADACMAALKAQQEARWMAAIAAARATAERKRQVPYTHPSLAERLAHLSPAERPLNVALRDGSRISTGQLASRHWWREQGLRIKRLDKSFQ